MRTSFQLLTLLVAAVVIAHGLLGPQNPSTNLAPVLTWVHFRGLLIVALLAAGNLFCAGCPFVLVRDAGRRLRPPARSWPRRLRTKWFGVALLIGVLFVYELFDLWALPRATAYLVLAYFGAALAIDLVFSGATFCKYLCPIGQFNFVASTMSPLELQVREQSTCRACRTADCIKGRLQAPDSRLHAPGVGLQVADALAPIPKAGARSPKLVVQRGCELGLFLPLKVGNLDCTFCLDCVQACPHDNIALAARLPGLELADARRRSGLGRLARRWDLVALTIVFVFGGLLNAFAMVSPVYHLETWLAGVMGARSEAPVLAVVFLGSLMLAPAVIVGGAAWLTGALTGGGRPIGRIVLQYVYTLVPFGFGMWLAHYGFHLLTSALTVLPIAQNVVNGFVGRPVLGEPIWRWTGLRPGTAFPIEIGCILVGAVGSLALAYRISDREYPDRASHAAAPWALVTVALSAAAVWILSQPMEMRGTGFLG